MPAHQINLAFYLPLIAVVWCLAVAGMGIGGALCAYYGSGFPSGELGGTVRQIVFAHTWLTLFGIVFTVGDVVAPEHGLFGLATNFGAFFLGFLQTLVGAGALHGALANVGCDSTAKCTLFTALEGVTWATCWVLFFALFPLAAAALKSKPEEKKHKEVEHF
ncbi:hypothetical protein BCR35DRAFT_334170 [Leucosporidium creatinivorum]|uniref:MARVEL domain-containing protein n=1 Tax=Leucosporidium creatinivorum TaxID=106004 RepID=A0A1Y2EGV3_9BASI|nr:hypothetical protein BCR35DRAFT_334170 [Leucosporidium creatinivorum]